jgi:MinD-like ATPase involved in chromosome partitioning or flagellar assembly
VVVVVGNYGSGKTEVAVNLAVQQKRAGRDVRLADLDLVNPYFRSREMRTPLSAMGIGVVTPAAAYLHADLPVLPPEVAGLIRQPAELTLLDAGGDDVGATVLAALADALGGKTVQMMQVVNPFRPFTDSIDGCLRIRREIERASRLPVTTLAGNANLIDDTTPEEIYEGYRFIMELSAASSLPVAFITAAKTLLPQLDGSRFRCPLLPISRQLVPPWRKSEPLGI